MRVTNYPDGAERDPAAPWNQPDDPEAEAEKKERKEVAEQECWERKLDR